MNIDLEQLSQIVISACKTELIPRFTLVKRQYKTDGSIVTEADLAMQRQLVTQLQLVYPNVGFLGEEMTKQQQQALLSSGQSLWCVDPVDGTSNFAAGFPYFCVSLALIEHNQITLGLVYDPIHDDCFIAQKGKGASLNGHRLSSLDTGLSLKQSIALIDFKRLPAELASQIVTDVPYGSQRSLGSIALELCWIAAGRGHIYLHAKQHLWDYAAANLILTEAGGFVCTLDGETVFNNTLKPRSALAACDRHLFDSWSHYLNVSITDDR